MATPSWSPTPTSFGSNLASLGKPYIVPAITSDERVGIRIAGAPQLTSSRRHSRRRLWTETASAELTVAEATNYVLGFETGIHRRCRRDPCRRILEDPARPDEAFAQWRLTRMIFDNMQKNGPVAFAALAKVAGDRIVAVEEQRTKPKPKSEGWSTGTKVAVAGGAVAVGAGILKLLKVW